MKPLFVLNDLHIGVIRTAGTTQATAYELRMQGLQDYRELLNKCDSDLLINGDAFDSASIPMSDLLQAYEITSGWLSKGHMLWGSLGNHDAPRNSLNFSSFQFFMKVLAARFPEQVVLVSGGLNIGHGRYILSHVANQDIFNIELGKIPECDYLFLHCNYNNMYAVEADHSLNLSEAQAKALPVKHIIMGHEHQQREELKGKVIVVGTQLCTSVADCLGNESKRMLKITDEGIESIDVLTVSNIFSEQDWQNLEDTGRFIRVTGKATAEQAAQVISAIAKFRASANALVITNAVKVEGVNDQADLELSHEEITSFDVMSALLKLLTPEEGIKIKSLLGAEK